MSREFIIGVDEVGRGSLAGPVTVAALALPIRIKLSKPNSKIPLRDSKKLSSGQRDEWFDYIKFSPKLKYAVAHVQPSVIDKINISASANLAATRAVLKLANNHKEMGNNLKVYLDGGLYLDEGLIIANGHTLETKTIIRGDQKFTSIMLASIVAKECRDRLMAKKARLFPNYGFENHVGYGTKAHVSAIYKNGPTPIHRLTFISNLA